MTDLTGQTIGHFQITDLLGEGGMAVVYKAHDTRLERYVALKLIRIDQFGSAMLDRLLKRFEREAKSLARLSHPNIVKVFEYGEHEGAPYLVVEYCPGGDLRQRLRGKPMDWREAINLLLPVARALRSSHQQGVIHRDVKPSNILFSLTGEPMLSDFGIAKILEYDDAATLTGTGVGVGTPGYMAPEQWTGETSPQSDQYGLAVALYEMLAGRKPYEADTPAGILIKQTSQPLPAPGQFVPGIPENVEAALLKALDKDPTRRYADMGAFIQAFEELLARGSAQPTLVADIPTAVDDEKTIDPPALPRTVADRPRTPTPPPSANTPLIPASNRQNHLQRLALMGIVVLLALAGMTWIWGKVSQNIPATPKVTASSDVTVTTLVPTLMPTEEITPTAAALPTEITDAKGVTMRLVPAGTFTMGSDKSDDEKPPHQVTLEAFYMDIYEVTNALYEACVKAGSCTAPHDTGSATHSHYYYGNAQYDNYPVIYVDWNQAKTYCEWRGARLPTEAEWEKAARGTDQRTYPWDEGIECNKANYWGKDGNCVGDTTPIGSYESGVSPYGMYDLAGNVWEWVSDWYEAYPGNTTGSSDFGTKYRVLRGGSWSDVANGVRSANRSRSDPTYSSYLLGFRCSRSRP